MRLLGFGYRGPFKSQKKASREGGFLVRGVSAPKAMSAGNRGARYAADVFAADAEITQFAVGHAAELGDGLTILAPIGERAGDVHGRSLSS